MSHSKGNACSPDTKILVKEVIQAIMVLDQSKKPFKQADIVSHLNLKGRRNWRQIYVEVRECLDYMGLELHQVKDATVKSYFVTSKTPPLKSAHTYALDREMSDRTLLTLVLAYIFMKNGVVSSVDLLHHLKDLGIYSESCSMHHYFGNVKKKVMSEFVDQLYLSVTKLSDPDLFEFKWGQRAEVEITKRAILEFVCQYGYGGSMKPEYHVSHYEKVLEQEGVKVADGDGSDEA